MTDDGSSRQTKGCSNAGAERHSALYSYKSVRGEGGKNKDFFPKILGSIRNFGKKIRWICGGKKGESLRLASKI